MKTITLAMIGLAAVLLLAPPAAAKKKAAQKAAPGRAAAKALVKEGLAEMEKRDFDAAIRKFTKAAEIQGDSATFFLLGYAHYQRGFKSGSPETADKDDALETVNAYAAAIELDADLKAVAQPYRLYHSLALSYEALNNYDQALDAYKEALQAAPANPMLPLYAARLRYRMGDMPKSAANLALSLAKARRIKKERLIIRTVKSDPLFSVLLGSPENRRIIRDAETGGEPRQEPTQAEEPTQP